MNEKIIRDPIHGNIALSEVEVRLLDTPHMQRLRNIKQNGLCYLIYPAMNSTRFEHSLGVLHLAGVMAAHLNLSDEDKSKIGIAGLLHDVGHCAFSHTSDEILKKMGHTHEENSSNIILNTEVSDIIKGYGLEPGDISDLIRGKGNLSSILSSEIDVDKMDYLIRDAYYAGVAYGVIDLERIIHMMKMVDNKIVLEEGGLEAVESLLINRNLMYQTVYRHHTKRVVESMFSHAMFSLHEQKKLSYEELIAMDDIDLIYRLRNSKGYASDIMKRIDERRLFKKVFKEKISLIAETFKEELYENKNEIENKIAEDYGIEKGYVFLDMPEPKLSEFRILVEQDNELKRIDEVSNLARALETSEQEKLTFCIYTALENIPKMRDFNPEKYITFRQTKLEKFV